jgi:hypothetical protein
MLTIFSTGKPFHGHAGMIQRNAIRSWLEMDPRVEVILFGDEEGAAEIAHEFKFRNEREVERSETGTKYLRFLFARAQEIASNDILCYVNCDIILPKSFWRAVQEVAATQKPFLMVGRRTNTDVMEPVDFSRPDWEQRIEELARTTGIEASDWCADYFVFRRGLYKNMPPLVNGRNFWDNWLMWKAQSLGAMVVDASRVTMAIHQNHDYGYHPGGATGVMDDPQTRRNYEIGANGKHLRTIREVSHKLTPEGIRRNWIGPFSRSERLMRPYWHGMLKLTRPVRHPLGLNQDMVNKMKAGVTRITGSAQGSRR